MRFLRFVPFAALVFLASCSSASFEVSNPGSGDGGRDTAVGGDGSPTDSGGDGGPDLGDVIVSDTGLDASEGIVTCGAPPPGIVDLYVDGLSTRGENGTIACPYHTIRGATELPWSTTGTTRTIHVAAGTYNESGPVHVHDKVSIVGAGIGSVTITGGGSCSSGNCIVEIDGGGTLRGVRVDAAGSTNTAIIMLAASATAPAVQNVRSEHAAAPGVGILARGSANIGPNVTCTGNYRGLDSIGSGVVHVIGAVSTDNLFENSGQSGIYMESNASLQFDAGEARGNTTNGIYLFGSALSHINNLDAHDNRSNGLWVATSASAIVRKSGFHNNNFGVLFNKGTTNSLDLGQDGDHGGNTFATATAATRNTSGGVCSTMGSSGATIYAVGDSFSTCSVSGGPNVIGIDSCDSVPTYADLFFTPTGVSNPYVTSSCSVAP